MNNEMKSVDSLVDKGESHFEAAKQTLSKAMESGSNKLIAGAEAIESTALHSAESLLEGANYLRTQPPGQMLKDCGSLCKKYPIQSIALAAVAGIFIGKSVWGSRLRQ